MPWDHANYFLADLPPGAELSAAMVREACQSLRHNRERFLAGRSTRNLIDILSEVAADWLNPYSKHRSAALEEGPGATGFSRAVLIRGLDQFFSQITPDQLDRLLRQELGHDQRLDRFSGGSHGVVPETLALARGPDLLVHITAGNIPNPALLNIVLGLLVRSAQFVKCATGTAFLPRLLAHSIYQADPKLGACLEIAEWPGGREHLETALYEEAACLTATGRDETLQAIRQRLPHRVRFLGYGHKLSFAYLTRESLSQGGSKQLLRLAVDDVTAWDQLGCLSPHVIYVEEGGSVSAMLFAEQLAEELQRREESEPRGPLPPAHAALIHLKREFYHVRASQSEQTRLWTSANSTAWTVVFEADPLFQTSCLHRFVYVKPAPSLPEVLHAAEEVRPHISTVGLAAPSDRASALAHDLALWGVPRICPLGAMQKPPLTWRHDGRPSVGDLIQWSDFEQHHHAR